MNLAVFVSVVAIALDTGKLGYVVAAMSLPLLWVGTRLLADKLSLVAKYRSDVTQGVLHVIIAVSLASPSNWVGLSVGLVPLIVGGAYEFRIARRDLRSGRRPLPGTDWVAAYLNQRNQRRLQHLG